jgi:hypothetical protein
VVLSRTRYSKCESGYRLNVGFKIDANDIVHYINSDFVLNTPKEKNITGHIDSDKNLFRMKRDRDPYDTYIIQTSQNWTVYLIQNGACILEYEETVIPPYSACNPWWNNKGDIVRYCKYQGITYLYEAILENGQPRSVRFLF